MPRTRIVGPVMLRACLAAALVGAPVAQAQQAAAPALSFSGRMGDKALIVIGGQPRTLAVGGSAGGVRLLAVSADSARVETAGRVLDLPLGGTPQAVGAVGASSAGSSTIVLTAGLGGHFNTVGMINGRPVQFMVDTGASSIAISQSEADRLGIDVSKLAPTGMASTANGAVPIWRVVLTSVRVGDVTVSQVEAVVVPAPMPYVLLGNSFLSRFQMQRENDVMRLELRR
jgi:aspartyl protease family protein